MTISEVTDKEELFIEVVQQAYPFSVDAEYVMEQLGWPSLRGARSIGYRLLRRGVLTCAGSNPDKSFRFITTAHHETHKTDKAWSIVDDDELYAPSGMDRYGSL